MQRLVDEYTVRKQQVLMQMKKGLVSKEVFLKDARQHIETYYHRTDQADEELLKEFAGIKSSRLKLRPSLHFLSRLCCI